MAESHNISKVDTVRYVLYPNVESGLEDKLDFYKKHLAPCISPYIWQCEAFNLKFDTGLGVIHGSTHFGDNVEDEWFIVFLLLELTRLDNQLVVKVEDEDGEFLLIEVANVLPRWIKPETSENRVYLHQGKLHIIPKPSPNFKFLPNGTPVVSDAIQVVLSHPNKTVASDQIQEVLKKKIEGYPAKIQKFQHYEHCYTPYGVAAILKQEPSLLSPAIQAFYCRDAIDLKVCKSMKYFPPETRVTTGVTFSRCLYAQLVHQKFSPDRSVGWKIPPESSSHFKSWDLGMKLACGFEILASRCKSLEPSSSPTDLSTDKKWPSYLKSLQDKNYFRGEIEGSLLYQELLSQAKSYYLTQFVAAPKGPELQVRTYLQSLPYTYEDLKEAEKHLLPTQDDSWLDMTMQQFDELLATKFGTGVPEEELGQKMTSSLQSFLSNMSMFEGVEVAEKPQSDSDMFKNILDFHVPGDSEDGSSSGMSDYSDDEEDDEPEIKDNAMEECMREMDRQLAKTHIGESFEKKLPALDIEEEDDEDGRKIVDLELNALKNLLESYTSQHSMSGPAGNLLSTMDIKLPQNEDSDF